MNKRITSLIVMSFLFLGHKPPNSVTLYLIGDSTCATKDENKRPETGWGEKLALFFDSKVNIENHAQNG